MALFKIYVGNLSFKSNLQTIRQLFEPFGEIDEIVMVNDEKTGKSKGFAIVLMKDINQGMKAVAALHGRRIDGRPLIVNPAKKKAGAKMPQGSPSTGYKSTGYGNSATPADDTGPKLPKDAPGVLGLPGFLPTADGPIFRPRGNRPAGFAHRNNMRRSTRRPGQPPRP